MICEQSLDHYSKENADGHPFSRAGRLCPNSGNHAATRRGIEDAIERLIALLDALDPDANLEPESDDEETGDLEPGSDGEENGDLEPNYDGEPNLGCRKHQAIAIAGKELISTTPCLDSAIPTIALERIKTIPYKDRGDPL